ncbi:glia maturation factor gamma isoform X2 [Lingula anatina]|uniref:Glia maturation factor gamma isoform X1 n=1 Tax=Lingula anatina TaxID=7574 RepID=A0A1S3I3D4_LINAN|nr:glia maturation factor gamma isoform X1 [Lingula anatina]XP_013392780.1 glia maturation factor gamma isoform X2 [Lingula anatina]|eukprot:XP_013392779.1 glia maturation factor gamma isoform X1 [Lingula anatina]
MAQNVKVCEVEPKIKETMRKFKFRKEKNNAAVILKIDMENMTVVLDEEIEDCTMDDLQNELPDHQPRFVVYSYCYNHDDGRVSYPLCFIFVSPIGCKPEMQMMYAGSKNGLVQELDVTKIFEVRNTEELTEEWLKQKLSFFR